MRNSAGKPLGTMEYRPVKIGGGGFVTSLRMNAAGTTRVCSIDVGGAYSWDFTTRKWHQLITSASMPAGFRNIIDMPSVDPYADSYGCYAIDVAESDENYLVMSFYGYLFKSTDKGAHWTQVTAFARASMKSNSGQQRLWPNKLFIDPLDKLVWYISTGDGLAYRTINGGTSFTQLSSIPTATGIENQTAVLFSIDRSSSPTSGRKSVVYAHSANNGTYRSTDGGGTFAQVTGGPTAYISDIKVDAAGQVWMVAYVETNNNLWKLVGTTWTNISTTQAQNWTFVAINPANTSHVVVMGAGGSMQVSLDRGATWANSQIFQAASWFGHFGESDVPWIKALMNGDNGAMLFLGHGSIDFDPAGTGRMYFANGIGVLWSTLPTSFNDAVGTIVYNCETNGIENIVARHALSVPDGSMLLTNLDKGPVRIVDPDVFPPSMSNLLTGGAVLDHGWGLDGPANDDPNFFVSGTGGVRVPQDYASSTDKGQSWTVFPTQPTVSSAGTIVVGKKLNMLCFPTQNGLAKYTLDGGTTWTAITFAGLPATEPSGQISSGWGFGNHNTNIRHIAACDRMEANDTFYAYNFGATDVAGVATTPSTAGMWKFQIIAGVWQAPVRVATDATVGVLYASYHSTLLCVPGQLGHMFLSPGQVGTPSTMASTNWRYSTDSGVTWHTVSGFQEVHWFGFGPIALYQTYPTIYVTGWYNGTGSYVFGNYVSYDNRATWTKLADIPVVDDYTYCTPDRNKRNRAYIGTTGNTTLVGDLKHRLLLT